MQTLLALICVVVAVISSDGGRADSAGDDDIIVCVCQFVVTGYKSIILLVLAFYIP